MKAIAIIGIVIMIFGIITLIFGGFPVSSESKSINIGPVETTVTEKESYPVPTVFSIAAIGAGLTLIILGRK
jgi:hypothetical protein